MGRAGRERAERHFDERQQARELQLLCEEVLHPRDRAACGA
jgi:hypothetical protein